MINLDGNIRYGEYKNNDQTSIAEIFKHSTYVFKELEEALKVANAKQGETHDMVTEKSVPTFNMNPGDIEIHDAVRFFCRLIGVEDNFVVGFTAEPGRLIVCMFLRDPDATTEKLVNDKGVPMVGDFIADFYDGSTLKFVEGSGRPITELISIEGDDKTG